MSKKEKLPSQKNASCIVCEDVRIEASGKYILIGAYPGETIRFFSKVSEENPGVLPLAFCFWFRDCRGVFDIEFALYDPNGDEIFERKLGERTVEDGQVMSLVIGFRNAQFKFEGKHRIALTVGGKLFEFPLFVISSTPKDPT